MYIVYKITNLINDKIYVGVHKVSDINLNDGYMGSGNAIRTAIKKYGKDNFKKEILVSFEEAEAAYLAESMVVDMDFVLRKDTYNMKCGGFGGASGLGKTHPNYGKKISDEQKAKQSIAMTGRKHSDDHKAKQSIAMIGDKNPQFGKVGKLSPNYGKPCSDETKGKLSITKLGHKNPNYGKKMSDETKEKLSASMRGRKHSHETKAKLCIIQQNRKPITEETRAKKSSAMIEYYRKRREQQ